MDDYRRLLLSQRGRPGSNNTSSLSDDKAARAPEALRGKDIRKATAQQRAGIAPLKKKADDAEFKIIELEEKIAKMDAVLADGSLFERDPKKADLISRARGELGSQLEKAEDAWMTLTHKYESAVKELEKNEA